MILTRCFAILTLVAAAAQVYADDHHPHHDDRARATHRFEDADHWSNVWDDPSRDAWQQPERVIGWLAIEPGMKVADIGAGTGYFNPHLSAAVGPHGIVHPVDVEPNMVEHMRERAKAEETPNVQPILGDADDPMLPQAVDRILMVDTFHHIDHRIAYFQKLRERLAPGGLFVDVDWKPGKMELGPSEKHKIGPEQVVAELTEAGFELVASHELEYQYVLVFRPLETPPE